MKAKIVSYVSENRAVIEGGKIVRVPVNARGSVGGELEFDKSQIVGEVEKPEAEKKPKADKPEAEKKP
jgi:hypothetical protein